MITIRFGSVRVLVMFVNGRFYFCSVLSKMRVLVRFVRFGFGSNPISTSYLYHIASEWLENLLHFEDSAFQAVRTEVTAYLFKQHVSASGSYRPASM